MKINLISDIHLNFEDLELPGGDLLILAGDALEIGHFRLAENTGRNVFLADRYKRFLNEELRKYWKVIYVCGNHEHYHGFYETNHEVLQSYLPDNVHFLENQSVELEGVHFWGATMWTDFHKGCPITMKMVGDGLNDFRLIRYEHGQCNNGYWTHKFNVNAALAENKHSVQALRKFLADHVDDKVVVVSHHAPTAESVHPKYRHEYYMNGGYHNHLEDLILDNPQIKVWCHGHMHDPVDYMVGETRVLSNPRGYKGYEQRAEEFDPGFTFEV